MAFLGCVEVLCLLQPPPDRQARAATSVSSEAGWARLPCLCTGRFSLLTSRSRPGLPAGLGGGLGRRVLWCGRLGERTTFNSSNTQAPKFGSPFANFVFFFGCYFRVQKGLVFCPFQRNQTLVLLLKLNVF